MEDFIVKFQRNKDSGKTGSLIIKFISDEFVEYENVELKITNQCPRTKYITNWVGGGGLPPLPVGEKPAKPTIHEPMFMNRFNYIRNGRELLIQLEEGEYYVALESEQIGFRFFVNEVKEFLFQFGFTSERAPFYKEIHAYNEKCKSEIVGSQYMHYASCPRIKISRGKNTYINIFVSGSKSTSLESRILIFIPNYSYNYREMKVELINPEEEKSAGAE